MSTNTLLTPCKARCGTFTLLPILASTIEPAVAGCVETRSQSDRLNLETRERSDRLKPGRAASKVRTFTSHEFPTLNYIGVRSQLENQRKFNVRYIIFPKCIRKIRIIRVQNIRLLRARRAVSACACEKTAKYKTLKYCTFQKKFVTLQPVRCSVRLRFRLIIRKYNI